MNKNAASGVDKVTAGAYEENLVGNIQALADRLKTKCYRAKLVRRCYIPKENGKERPLGIPALEDRLVQLACSKLLTAIFEADFLESSYGYRPNRGAKDAANDLRFNLQFGKFGYVVEADIRGFFDHMDHDWLLRMLKERIDDVAFLNLICKWLKVGILKSDGICIGAYVTDAMPQKDSLTCFVLQTILGWYLCYRGSDDVKKIFESSGYT